MALNGLALGDPTLTRSAGVFGATGDDHTELGGDDVQPFADILANHMTLGPTGAIDIRFDNHFHPFQMLGQCPPVGLTQLWRSHRRGAVIGVNLGFDLHNGRLDILKFQLVLGRVNLFGFGPEEGFLEGGNQSLKPRILILLRTDDRLQLCDIIWQFIRGTHARDPHKTRAE